MDIEKKPRGRPKSDIGLDDRLKTYRHKAYMQGFKDKKYHCVDCNLEMSYYSKNRHIKRKHTD